MADLQSARFLTFDRRITECWSQLGAAVRTAQALGLHRDGATMVQCSYLRSSHLLMVTHSKGCPLPQLNIEEGYGSSYRFAPVLKLTKSN